MRKVVAVTSIGGNYTVLYIEDGTRPAVRRTLKQWEDLLPEDLFLRIHRGTVINLDRIDRIGREKDGPCLAWLSGFDEPFEVSRRIVARLKKAMDTC